MKILFYNHTGQVSGAERMLLMILSGLDRSRFESVVLCPEQGSLAKLTADLGVATETISALEARFTIHPRTLIHYLVSFFGVIRQLRRKVIAIKPAFVHANSIRAGLVATTATLGLGTQVVWHLHDLLPRHPLSSAIRVFAVLFPRARMIAVSQAVADNFAGRLFSLRDRVRVVLNGIDLERFQATEGIRAEMRRELQLDEDGPVFGIVGVLTPRKGQLELIRAFPAVVADLPQAALVIVGAALFNRDQEYAQLLEETAAQLGIAERVRFLGARSDVPAVMQALDVLVVNSSVEPFGLVLLEAMACGIPIIAAVSGGIPELIKHGRNGWLVRQGDHRALADSMVNLGSHPEIQAQLAEQGRRHVVAGFSATRFLEELQAFYEANRDLTLPARNEESGAWSAGRGEVRWLNRSS